MAKKKDSTQQEVQAGGGSQAVVRIPQLTVVADNIAAHEKLSVLAAQYREADEVVKQLQACVNVSNAAIHKMETIHEAMLEVMRGNGLEKVDTDIGAIELLKHPGSPARISPGVKQLESYYEEKHPGNPNIITEALIGLRKQKLEDIQEENKIANAAINPEDKNNINPPPTFSIGLNYKAPLTTTGHEAHIILEVSRFHGIPGFSWYSYLDIKQLEGKQIKCQYEKVTDAPHGTDVHVREGKEFEEMHGWVNDNFGVWRTRKENICIEINNYNRIVNGNRKDVTEEDLDKAKALGRLTPGTFRPTCLRVEGIKPQSLFYMENGKWEKVRLINE
jgi:hypothetical protein